MQLEQSKQRTIDFVMKGGAVARNDRRELAAY
jgi:hypothetical protein